MPAVLSTAEEVIRICMTSWETIDEDQASQLKQAYELMGRGGVGKLLESNGIVPFGAHVLASIGCEPEHWLAKHDSYVARNREICCRLEELFLKLERSGLESVVVYENFGDRKSVV